MSADKPVDPPQESMEALQAKAAALEKQLRELETQSAEKLRQVELKAEAVRAGIVDLDGLRLLDSAALAGKPDSASSDPAAIIAKLRQDKPWLFAPATTSSLAVPPTMATVKRKMATEMSVEEWRAARAELLRKR